MTSAFSLLATLVGLAFILPSLFGLQRYVITGTSMTGTIDYGSIAFEEVVPVSELQVGDIITYAPPAGASPDHLVTHRIVAIHGDAFRTKAMRSRSATPGSSASTTPSSPGEVRGAVRRLPVHLAR